MKKCFSILVCLSLSVVLFAQGNSKSFSLIENAYINMSSVSFELEEQYTVMGWMKWNASSVAGESWSSMVAMNERDAEDYTHFWIQSNSDNSKLEFALQLDANSNNLIGESRMVEGEWFHFAATFNGNQQKLYINGVEESGKMSTGRTNSFEPEFTLSLGSMAAWNFAQNFEGAVDKISVWENALTPDEIVSIMNNQNNISNQGLVSYYSIDEDANNFIADASKYKHVIINREELIEESDSDYDYINNKIGNCYLWQSDIAYQKSHHSDEVFVLYGSNIYKLNGWYSFDEKPNEDTQLWEFVKPCGGFNATIVLNDYVEK